MTFRAASTFERVAPGEHRGVIDADWAQGRGIYGGLVSAIVARALEADAPPGHALVTLTAAFCAPATAGPALVRTEVVRAGRNVSTMRASLEREGLTLATTLATLARPREGALAHRGLSMPGVPPPDAVADGPAEHYFPAFARRFEFRQCVGPIPFSGATEARVGGWCRLAEDDPTLDASLVLAILDAWPPAAVALSAGWCPVASIDLTVHVLASLPRTIDRQWLFFDATSRHAGGGMAEETATLFTEPGEPIATCRQLIAIFPPEAPPPGAVLTPSRR